MPSRLLVLLLDELKENVLRLRADLAILNVPQSEGLPVAEEYCFQAYEALKSETLQEIERGKVELIHAFYKSLRVLSEGHSGLFAADERAFENAYRITLEAAIEMGEQLLEQSE